MKLNIATMLTISRIAFIPLIAFFLILMMGDTGMFYVYFFISYNYGLS